MIPRKLLHVILFVTLVLSLTGCGGQPASPSAQAVSSSAQSLPSTQVSPPSSQVSVPQVSVSSQDVTIIVPAYFFEEQPVEEVISAAADQGIIVEPNSDGSFTYSMSNAKHQEYLLEMREGLIEAFEDILAIEETSIKAIEPNHDLTEFVVRVDQKQFENSLDGFSLLGMYIGSAYYQIFEGKPEDDIKATFKLVDTTTKEVFETVVYPDAFEGE